MNKFSFFCLAIITLCCTVSCEKKRLGDDGGIACPAIYRPADIKFQVIDQRSSTDLFFAANAAYAITDIKVYLKNYQNKTDSITPGVKLTDNQKYFYFQVQNSKTTDTCFVKIKNLKTDTLIYTVGTTLTPCPQPYIKSLKINNSAALSISASTVVQIKK